MRGTLTLPIIACLLAFVESTKQRKDTRHHAPYQNERVSHNKVEHEGAGGGSTHRGSGVFGSGEGKLVFQALRTELRFAVNFSKLWWLH